MSELTEQQKKDYWRYNLRLTMILLAIWFVVASLSSFGLWAAELNKVTSLGFLLATTWRRRLAGDLRHRDRHLRSAHEQEGPRVRHLRGGAKVNLRKIFTLYTVGFLGVTVLLGLAEHFFDLPNRWIGWIFMACRWGSTSSSAC